MGRAWWVVLATSGCGSVFGLGDPQPLPPDAPGASCIVAGFDLCAHQQPNGPIHFEVDTTINTTLDCNVVLFNPTGGSVCVIYASDLTVTSTVRAAGARPLVLAATGNITIDGTLDVSSGMTIGTGAAANDPSCMTKRIAGTTSGGGAGGSFRGKGGDGGAGTVNPGAAALAGDSVALPAVLRGGCPGSIAFNPASSGGAVRVVASTSLIVTATGRVLANGEGGRQQQGLVTGSGGVAGASGGMIQLAAPSVAVQGVVTANGGGGSEGDDMSNFGAPGIDGGPSSDPAAGGAGMSAGGGDGGAGGAGATLTGVTGVSPTAASSGGGGGGGGVGYIVISGDSVDTSGSTISPAALMNE
jgi:hypothetical protein